jgi:hypothetical protein
LSPRQDFTETFLACFYVLGFFKEGYTTIISSCCFRYYDRVDMTNFFFNGGVNLRYDCSTESENSEANQDLEVPEGEIILYHARLANL